MTENIKNLLILIFISSFFSSCNFGYKKENGKVFYKYWNAGMGISARTFEIKDVDFETFEEIEFDSDCSFKFARDKSNLYIDGHEYNNVDPKTFKYIGNYIFADKDFAYFFGFYNNFNDCSIKNVNPNKIELLEYPWSRSGNYLINGKSTIYLNDIKDFVPIDENWGKTKKHIINTNQILLDADVESFEVISSFEGKDKYFNYEFGAINQSDFKKESFNEFPFNDKDICLTKPVQFNDIYTELVSYNKDKSNPIKIIEKL